MEMLLPGGIISFLLTTFGIGVYASKQIKGNSVNVLVARRGLVFPLAAATLMAQSVYSNATLGNTDLASEFSFWAGASLPLDFALCLFLVAFFWAKPMNCVVMMGVSALFSWKQILEFVRSLEV